MTCCSRWCSWLRHCGICRKVGTVALGLTHPLTEMSTRDISGGWRRPVLRADNLAISLCRLSRNSGSLNLVEPYVLSRPVQRLLYLDPWYSQPDTRRRWVVSTMLRPLCSQEIPGTHCTGGCVVLGADLAPPGFDPRTVQPVASCSTDYVIPDAPTGKRNKRTHLCLII